MTPQESATNADLAVRVMGWVRTRIGGEGKYRDAYRWVGAAISQPGYVVDWHWQPATKLDHAWQVVDAMRAKGWTVYIDDELIHWRCTFELHSRRFTEYDGLLMYAICRAALQAMEYGKLVENK